MEYHHMQDLHTDYTDQYPEYKCTGRSGLVMLMAQEDSIRDVIAFPKVKDASCLMSEAPNTVDAKQLEELGIAIAKPEAETEE